MGNNLVRSIVATALVIAMLESIFCTAAHRHPTHQHDHSHESCTATHDARDHDLHDHGHGDECHHAHEAPHECDEAPHDQDPCGCPTDGDCGHCHEHHLVVAPGFAAFSADELAPCSCLMPAPSFFAKVASDHGMKSTGFGPPPQTSLLSSIRSTILLI
jgi:hypothetical protein